MNILAISFSLQLRHRFTLSVASRIATPAVLVKIESEGFCGYGEASLPPYLSENQESVGDFIQSLDLSRFSVSDSMDSILDYVMSHSKGDFAAKAAVDIALHDLFGKVRNCVWWQSWGADLRQAPPTSYTIGIGSDEEVQARTREASAFKVLKVKLGGARDREMILAIRSVSSVPLTVDVNQGWSDPEKALEEIYWCKEQGVVFVEQPLPKTAWQEMAWLQERSPLPLIADESFQSIADLDAVERCFSGINIKLMKCGGLREARRIIAKARQRGLQIMLGCMTETSCAISAAAQIAPFVDWADLDGALLIGNDPFEGASLVDGKILPTGLPGIGIRLSGNLRF